MKINTAPFSRTADMVSVGMSDGGKDGKSRYLLQFIFYIRHTVAAVNQHCPFITDDEKAIHKTQFAYFIDMLTDFLGGKNFTVQLFHLTDSACPFVFDLFFLVIIISFELDAFKEAVIVVSPFCYSLTIIFFGERPVNNKKSCDIFG